MFIHGKLFLTHHSIMLDETRSLIQKALRRKEWVLALQAAKELLGHDKDQLPWKSLVTYLFEDHCLSDTDVLMVVYKAYEENTVDAKYRCIELLMECSTCRVTACLPVIALDTPYEPKHWDENIEVRESVSGLVEHTKGLINTDQLLEHLLRAWSANNPDGVITYMKLATMVAEHEKRQLTLKGKQFLISSVGKIRKIHFGLVVLSALYKNTDDATMRGYLAACHRLATIPDVCIRLILFAPLTRLMFRHKVAEAPHKKIGRVDWKTVRRLTYMPPWAVDKHTFRGKFGRGTKSILKKRPHGMTEEQYDEFHGPREKRDLQSFFDEGVKCTKEALDENPFWERMKELYFLQPPKQQKTQAMTEKYYSVLRAKYPELFQTTKSVFFDYPSKRNGDLFSAPTKKTDKPVQKNLKEFFKQTAPSSSSPSLQVKQVTSTKSPENEQTRKRKRSEPLEIDEQTHKRKRSESLEIDEQTHKRKRSESLEIEQKPQEILSRSQKRRQRETLRRKSEYETEHLHGPRKLSGVMSGDFAAAAKRLGCPVTLPGNIFDDDDEILKSPPLKSSSRSGRVMSFSEESSSDMFNIGSPLGSPMAAYLSGAEQSTPRAGPSHSRGRADSSLESNGLDQSFLSDLGDEFEDEIPAPSESDTEKQEYMSQEEEEMEEPQEEEEEQEEEESFLAFRGPLLQLPTSANKVYVCADIEADKVIKGPYHNKNNLHTTMFLNQIMRDVIGDPHTMDFEPEPPYITFPLLRGHGATMEITTRDFTDCISQADIEDAEFLTRDCLGIVQLHKLQANQIRKLPVSIWSHFLYRFALNVGDSGLYNALTDSKLSFVYGIDLSERRGNIDETDSLIKIMFSKAPRKDLCEAILVCMKHKKIELLRLVSKPINYAQMDRLAREYGIEYDRFVFIERIKKARQLVAKL